MKIAVSSNVYAGESDFRKIRQKRAKLYKTSIHAGETVVFFEKNVLKWVKLGSGQGVRVLSSLPGL